MHGRRADCDPGMPRDAVWAPGEANDRHGNQLLGLSRRASSARTSPLNVALMGELSSAEGVLALAFAGWCSAFRQQERPCGTGRLGRRPS